MSAYEIHVSLTTDYNRILGSYLKSREIYLHKKLEIRKHSYATDIAVSEYTHTIL